MRISDNQKQGIMIKMIIKYFEEYGKAKTGNIADNIGAE